MLRPYLLSIAGSLLLLVACPAAATQPSLEGRALRPGESVTLAFALPPGGGVEEWEAYLSLDGGESYPVRLTREHDPSSPSFTFRVPNLPAESARILIRVGGRDEDDDGSGPFERDLAFSGTFRILPGSGSAERAPWPDRGALPRRGDFTRIEWLVGEALPPVTCDVPGPDGLSSRAPRIAPLSDFPEAVHGAPRTPDPRCGQAVRVSAGPMHPPRPPASPALASIRQGATSAPLLI